MGLLDFFRRKEFNAGVFTWMFNQAAPGIKSTDYLKSYMGWVYACTNAIADSVGSMNIRLMQKSGDKEVEVQKHDALSLLYRPNAEMTLTDLLTATQSFLELSGESFWYMPMNLKGSKPAEIWPLTPSQMLLTIGDNSRVSGYVYINGKGVKVPLELSEIIHFKRFNPINQYRGMGTVAAAALAIDTDTNAANWNNNFFYNSAMPSGIFKATGTLTAEQRKRIKEQFDAQYRGTENAHRNLVLEGGTDYTRIALTQKEMDFLEQRRFSRDEILAIFGVPKSVLGIVEDVNRANAEATDYIFGKRKIDPKDRFIVEKINQFYLPKFGLKPDTNYIKYDSPIPEDKEFNLKRKQTGIQTGYYTINEVRAEEGKLPVEGGDEVLIPINYVPLGAPIEPKPEPTKGGGEQPEDNRGARLKAFGKLLKGEKPAKIIEEVVKETMVKRRNKFTKVEIIKRKDQFQKILLDIKAYSIKKIKAKKAIGKGQAEDILQSVFANMDGDWIKVLDSANTDGLTASMLFAGQEAIRQVGVNMTFDLKHPRAMDWLKENALKLATQVLDTLKDEMKKRIIAGVDEGKGSEAIASDIADFFDDQSGWRALRIARSEVISGYAQGSLEGYKQSEVVSMKKWSTSGRDPCPTCLDNESQGSIGLTDSFNSGDDAPGAHPNCECIIIPVLKE